MRELPSIFDGTAKLKAWPQVDSKATLAPQVNLEEFLCQWKTINNVYPCL